jgi:16S rRNA (adenine1518-N6/adenine1519-N6)-dimethyltransferase
MGKRRALGQHYLVDPSIVDFMIDTSDIKQDERVLEIGTGRGVLTERLCGLTEHVEAFELDDANYLATKRRADKRLDLHLGDAFSARPTFDVLVSSLPYSESSNFVEWLSQRDYDRAIVILQKEFVEKLMSEPRRRSYRAISVVFQLSSSIKVVGEVERDSFAPPPRVSSVVAVIKPKVVLTSRQIRLVKLLFSQKKKKMGVALKRLGFDDTKLALDQLTRRVWEFSAPEIGGLLQAIG